MATFFQACSISYCVYQKQVVLIEMMCTFFLFTVHVTELTFDIFCSLLRCSVSARIHAGNSQWGQDLYQIAFEFVFPWDFTRYFTIFKNNYNNGIKL